MEINAYALETIVRDRLREARASAARRVLAGPHAQRRLRVRVGLMVIAVGQRLLGSTLTAGEALEEASRG